MLKNCLILSSQLPEAMIVQATELYPGPTNKGYRIFAFNGDLVTLVNFLDIGSTVDAAVEITTVLFKFSWFKNMPVAAHF
jgi:hypothetical protein